MSTGVHHTPPAYASDQEKGGDKDIGLGPTESRDLRGSFSASGTDSTHRMLKSRHIQLIGIGGTIGTALYVRPYKCT